MREREEPRLSRDSLATQVFQTQETLHKLEMPWKGTSSLLSSLPITNSGSSWTPARVMKGAERSGLSEHSGWDLFKLHLLTLHYGVSMATGVCFSVLHVEGLYLTDSPLRKIWSCATSFLVVWMGSTMSQCFFPWDTHREKCPGPESKILKPRIPLETQENGVCSKDTGHDCGRSETEARPLPSSHLASSLDWVFRAMKWKDHLDIVHPDSFIKSVFYEGAGTRENSALGLDQCPLGCLFIGHLTSLRTGCLQTVHRITELYSKGIQFNVIIIGGNILSLTLLFPPILGHEMRTSPIWELSLILISIPSLPHPHRRQ